MLLEHTFHPPGEFIDANEAMIYLVDGKVWKVYPRLPLASTEKYQRLTSAVGRVLNGQREVIVSPVFGGEYTFTWHVVNIDEIFLYGDYATTVSEYIPGQTLLEVMGGGVDVNSGNICDVFERVSEKQLLRRFAPLTPYITPVNVKPDFENYIFYITDVCPYVGTVMVEGVNVDAILARYY